MKMKSMRTMAAMISSGVILHIATVAYAQQAGMVVVDTRSIAKTIAKHIKVNVNQIPKEVEAPLAVAKSVCKISPDRLEADAASGSASCLAQKTSSALEQIVLEQIKARQK
jgi:hypothetical protein